MKPQLLRCIFFVLLSAVVVAPLPLISVFKTGIDVVKLAFKIEAYIRQRDDLGESVDEIVAETERLITESNTNLLTVLLLQTKLEKIEDAVMVIHSSLIDVKNLLRAKHEMTYSMYRERFVRFFEENGAIKYIRFLPEILTYRIPGLSGELTTEIIARTRCNMTALKAFADYYLTLVSDGIALQILYYKFTTDLTPSTVIDDEWLGASKKIQDTFTSMEKTCIANFPILAQEDIQNAVKFDKFARENQERYGIYNWTDVMFYDASVGTEQFHFMKFQKGRLFFDRSHLFNKVVVFGSREAPLVWNAQAIEAKLAEAELRVPSKTDKKAATEMGEAIESYIWDLGYNISAILVFFEGGDFKTEGIHIHKDSQVVKYTMQNVTQRYCFNYGIVCSFESPKEVSGQFQVYVYPLEKKSCGIEAKCADVVFQTAGATKIFQQLVPIILVLSVAMLICRN